MMPMKTLAKRLFDLLWTPIPEDSSKDYDSAALALYTVAIKHSTYAIRYANITLVLV